MKMSWVVLVVLLSGSLWGCSESEPPYENIQETETLSEELGDLAALPEEEGDQGVLFAPGGKGDLLGNEDDSVDLEGSISEEKNSTQGFTLESFSEQLEAVELGRPVGLEEGGPKGSLVSEILNLVEVVDRDLAWDAVQVANNLHLLKVRGYWDGKARDWDQSTPEEMKTELVRLVESFARIQKMVGVKTDVKVGDTEVVLQVNFDEFLDKVKGIGPRQVVEELVALQRHAVEQKWQGPIQDWERFSTGEKRLMVEQFEESLFLYP